MDLLFVAENENLKPTVAFFLTNHPVRSLAPLEVEIQRTQVSLQGFLTEQKKGAPQGEKEGSAGKIGYYVNHPGSKERAGRGSVRHSTAKGQGPFEEPQTLKISNVGRDAPFECLSWNDRKGSMRVRQRGRCTVPPMAWPGRGGNESKNQNKLAQPEQG